MADEVFESKRGVSDKWIDNNVYKVLEKIEDCERRMKNGCIDLIEYIQTSYHNILDVQLQNMQIMLHEFDILIENTKAILSKSQHEEVKKKLELLEQTFRRAMSSKIKSERLFIEISNNISGKKRIAYVLQPLFYKISNLLSKLRSEMVSNLSHILFIQSSKSQGIKKEI